MADYELSNDDLIVIPDDNDFSYSAIITWLRIGMTPRFWVNGNLYTIEIITSKAGNLELWLWANHTALDSSPFFERKFQTLADLESYEFVPGQTLSEIWNPDMLDTL